MTKFLITSLIAGLLLGLAFAGTDLFNPRTAAAEADRVAMETAHQQAMNQLQERLATAETEAELRELQRQQALLDAKHQRDLQMLAQEPAQRDLAFRTWMIVLTILAGGFAIALSIGSTLWIGSRALAHVRSVQTEEKHVIRDFPAIEKRIPNVAEREPYDALDQNQVLYNQRINDRLQELVNEKKEQDDAALLAARLKAIKDPAKMSAGEYQKQSRAD